MTKKERNESMLELMKSYTKPEMTAMFGTRDMQGLQRKVERNGVSFDVVGRGESAIFTITNIENPFKIYCITELGFDGHADFYKIRNYYYYYFNDIEFRAMPNEVQENRMRLVHKGVSRQTIAGYLQKLYRRNFIELNTNNFVYYFAFKDKQRIVEKEEYLAAWREYWKDIKNGHSSYEAIYNMRSAFDGVARKQEIPEINGIYNKEIEFLRSLIQEDIERELEAN